MRSSEVFDTRNTVSVECTSSHVQKSKLCLRSMLPSVLSVLLLYIGGRLGPFHRHPGLHIPHPRNHRHQGKKEFPSRFGGDRRGRGSLHCFVFFRQPPHYHTLSAVARPAGTRVKTGSVPLFYIRCKFPSIWLLLHRYNAAMPWIFSRR